MGGIYKFRLLTFTIVKEAFVCVLVSVVVNGDTVVVILFVFYCDVLVESTISCSDVDLVSNVPPVFNTHAVSVISSVEFVGGQSCLNID